MVWLDYLWLLCSVLINTPAYPMLPTPPFSTLTWPMVYMDHASVHYLKTSSSMTFLKYSADFRNAVGTVNSLWHIYLWFAIKITSHQTFSKLSTNEARLFVPDQTMSIANAISSDSPLEVEQLLRRPVSSIHIRYLSILYANERYFKDAQWFLYFETSYPRTRR